MEKYNVTRTAVVNGGKVTMILNKLDNARKAFEYAYNTSKVNGGVISVSLMVQDHGFRPGTILGSLRSGRLHGKNEQSVVAWYQENHG